MDCKDMDLTGIEEAQRPIFYCSFGKDSSAVLHAISPWLHKTMVVFVDCGGLYPDIVNWAHFAGEQLPKFFYLRAPGDIFEDILKKGWPTDIETEDLGELSDLMARDPLVKHSKVRLWTKCTYDRFWLPAYAFAQMYQPDLYISGEKRLDRPYATDWDQRHMGAGKSLRPLLDWSDEDVWAYIDKNDIPLAKTFVGRQADRRDCYVCFGHCISAGRIDYLRQEYPDLYSKLFEEMGFKHVVAAMVGHLRKSHDVWTEIQGKL
jgi:3'-phosphoadenosine 5'-phosphosulfate sulfotransferase (PAPS reductase)/FAD synthetase